MDQKRSLTCLISYRHGLHDKSENPDKEGSPSPIIRMYDRLILRGIMPYYVEHYFWESDTKSLMTPNGRIQGVLTLPTPKQRKKIHGELKALLDKIDFVVRMDDPSEQKTRDLNLHYIQKQLEKLNQKAGARQKPQLFCGKDGDWVLEDGTPFSIAQLEALN